MHNPMSQRATAKIEHVASQIDAGLPVFREHDASGRSPPIGAGFGGHRDRLQPHPAKVRPVATNICFF